LRWWIPATIGGWFLGWTFFLSLLSKTIPVNIFILSLLATGSLIGLMQWLILKAKLTNSLRWIPANAIAIYLTMNVIPIGARLLPREDGWQGALSKAIAYGTGGVMYAIVTGSFLVWLVGRSGTKNSS
jgi:hypothetical protein